MSWLEVDGAGWSWQHDLVIPIEKILIFSLARGFDLVLSLGVTTPLTNQSWALFDLVFLGKNVLIC